MSQQNETITLKTNIMKTLIISLALLSVSFSSFATEKNTINDVPQTKTIVSIEYGVTCGKTGKSAVYVYHKAKTAANFNPATDREIVYTQNLAALQNTVQYQNYIKSL